MKTSTYTSDADLLTAADDIRNLVRKSAVEAAEAVT